MKSVVYFNQKGIAPALILLFALIGLIIGVYLVQNYTSFLPRASSGASLSLAPQTLEINKGCEANLDIMADTASSKTAGTDVVLLYDPLVVSVLSAEGAGLYSNYPPVSVDNNNGKLRISGLASPSAPFTGFGKFATVKIKIHPTASASSTKLSFDFDPNNPYKTSDSNIVESGTVAEVLKSVTNADITIGSGSSCSPITSTGPEIKVNFEGSKAAVNWSGVTNASIYDKIEVLQGSSGNEKKSAGWVYTSNCSTTEPTTETAKTSGTCDINLVGSGEFLFRLYQNTAKVTASLNSPAPTPLPSPSALPQTNLLKNPSFENVINNYPTDWWRRSKAASDSGFKSGSKSLKVTGPTSFTYSQQNINLAPQTQYTASVWIKAQNVVGKGGGIRFAQTNTPSYVIGQTSWQTGTFEWKRVAFTFTTPATFTNGRMDLIWELSSGTIWFDDVSLCTGVNSCL